MEFFFRQVMRNEVCVLREQRPDEEHEGIAEAEHWGA